MARPKRVRKVSFEPVSKKFTSESKGGEVTLTLDEFESIRLMDYLCLTHDEASSMLNVSRTTVTEIYDQARKKIAKALAEGKSIVIDGGDYEYVSPFENVSNESVIKEGDNHMKIAVTFEEGLVFGHFGHTPAFKIYEVEGKKVVSSTVVPTEGTGHGALAYFLQERGVELLICGGMGQGAVNAMANVGIEVIRGVSGEADKAVEDYLAECLVSDPNAATCHHHDGEEGHECHCGDHEHEEGHECHCHDHEHEEEHHCCHHE